MPNPQKTPVQIITINEDHQGQRIDNFLMTFLKTLPKTRIYRLLRKGEIRVNKKRTQPSYKLNIDDQIRLPPLTLEEKNKSTDFKPRLTELIKKSIIFEDKNLLIINKPSGIPVHGGTGLKGGVVDILRVMFPKLTQLELVHRLDRETSGCLLLAKKRSVLKELHELMREGKVVKIYLALTKGQWKNSELTVDVPLRKNQLTGGERIVRVDTEGKNALTVFEPIQSYGEAMLMQATLHTGRTHQIRVHAQYRKHPIAGDEKYGDKEFNKKMRELGLKRLFLHASQLEFKLASGQKVKVKAPLSGDLQKCLDGMSY